VRSWRFVGILLALWAVAVALAQNPDRLRPVREAIQGFLIRAAWTAWEPVIGALRSIRW
jgi:hypothetical protein